MALILESLVAFNKTLPIVLPNKPSLSSLSTLAISLAETIGIF
jgi:hypothetical protein